MSEIVKQDKLDLLFSTKKIKNIKPINENTYLRNYIPLIDSKICFEHGIDYFKLLNEKINFNIEKNIYIFFNVSVIVSALVNSFAIIYMLEIMQDIYKAGGSIFYTDPNILKLKREGLKAEIFTKDKKSY